MSKAMVGRRANAVVSKSSIHHKILPWCEHVGESLGESKTRASSSSTLTSEASVSPSFNSLKDEEGDSSWTDVKHSSYLSCMEEMFVRNMYDREYCAMDICGESASSCEQECVESKLFKGGGWQPLPCRRLHSWEIPSPSSLSSPWIQHFKSRVNPPGDAGVPMSEARSDDSGLTEKLVCKTSTAYELEDDENPAEVPDVEKMSSTWLNRMNSQSPEEVPSTHPPGEDVSSASYTGKSSILRDNINATTTIDPVQKSSCRIFETIDQVVPLGKKCKRFSDSGEKWSWTNRMNIVRR